MYEKISFWKILLNGEGPFVALTSISAAIIRLKGLLSFPCDVCRQAGNPSQQLSLGPMVGTAYTTLQKIAGMGYI
jgi:hypothetical protein